MALTGRYRRRLFPSGGGLVNGLPATAGLVVQAVNMTVWSRRPGKGVIHHPDQGSQYTSLAFGRTLRNSGVIGLKGSIGGGLDDTLVENFFATLQSKLLDRSSWTTRASLTTVIVECLGFLQSTSASLGFGEPTLSDS